MTDNTLNSFLNVSDGPLKLELAAYPGGLFPKEVPPPPLAIEDCGPLTRLLGGLMQPLALLDPRPVVLLVSRDTYPRIDEAASRLTNPDVDALWQRYYQAKRRHPALNALACQENPQGGLRPFEPLFTCRLKQSFFEPLCPHCGGKLALCTDDALLAANGLQAYTMSLRRYLSCPGCNQTTPVFYAASPEAQPAVQGPADLIRGWAGLTTGELPCRGCAVHKECYGDGSRVLERIRPVAFYPFHMLIFDAAALDALTYLALASGTPLAELGKDMFVECPVAVVPMPGEDIANNLTRPDTAETPPIADMSATKATKEDDTHIGQIIHDIRARWSTPTEVAAAPPQPQASPIAEDDDFRTETIIVRQTLPPAQPELPSGALGSPEETVIVRQASAPAVDHDATLVIAPVSAPPAEAKAQPEVATPPTAETTTKTPPPPAASPAQTPSDLTETVIIGKPAEPVEPPKASDDELAETIVLKPKK